LDTTKNLLFVQFLNPQTGYIGAKNMNTYNTTYIYKTTNSGSIWNNLVNYSAEFDCMYFVDANTGFLSVTFPGFPAHGQLTKTINGGNSWELVRTENGGGMPNLYFFDHMTGWFSGYQKLYKTIDGGNGWTEILIPSLYLYRILFLDFNKGYYLSQDNRVFKTINAGMNWNEIYISNYILNDLFFTDTLNGYLAGKLDSGVVLKTSNGGYTWNRIFTTFKQLKKLKFSTSNVGYVLGDTNRIFRTSNGGYDWIVENLDSSYKFNDFWFVNAYTGWVIGEKGIIMQTINGGSTRINLDLNESLLTFLLNQNYPNPFNPSTNIKYQISKNSFVKIAVYNVLGEEVAILENGFKQAGFYRNVFSLDNYKLSSGIYFYKLTAGDFSKVMKMMIIK